MCADFQNGPGQRLRIFPGPDTEARPIISRRTALAPNEAKETLAQAIYQSGRTSGLRASPGKDLQSLVKAINSVWRTLGNFRELISEDTLSKCLACSPQRLQYESGPSLHLRAALSEGATQNKNLNGQASALRDRNMSVADPASAAIVLAACLAHRTLLGGEQEFVRHYKDTLFRTKRLDPVSGKELSGQGLVIKYTPDRGIIAEPDDPKLTGKDIWCAGTDPRPETLTTAQKLWRFLGG